MKPIWYLLLVIFSFKVSADALVQNTSMNANTIAEFYIEEGGVRVELEIGMSSVAGMRDLLPEGIYSYLGFGDKPWRERIQDFYHQTLIIHDGETPYPAELLSIEPSQRVQRDLIDGSPLPVVSEDLEEVIKAVLFYSFSDLPESIYIELAHNKDLLDAGFIAYHNGIAINDFNYLGGANKLSLDWQDAWYSRFDSKALRRTYFAPMNGFIYVEPFEVRKEIIVRPKDLQRWVDLGLDDTKVIKAEDLANIKLKAAEFLSSYFPVEIDGNNVQGELQSINFLERTLTSSSVIEPPRDLLLDGAILGVIYVYPQPTLANNVKMTWDLWDERVQVVPVSAVDELGGLPSFLDPEWRVLEWKNFIKNPTIPSLNIVEQPPATWQVWLASGRWLLYGLGIGLVMLTIKLLRASEKRPAPILMTLAGILVLMGLSTQGKSNVPSQAEGERIVGDLLHNVYRAFDFREESDIYDTLTHSVSGELLTDIYLETRKGLVLQSQGGARAKVKDIAVNSVELTPLKQGFQAKVNWVVNGSVGHWGHIHKRNNQYQALLNITPVESQWKLTEMTVLQEERL